MDSSFREHDSSSTREIRYSAAEDKMNENQTRNDTLEEVAKEFEKMPFGDTAASFAVFGRNMKT